jgi:transposase
MKAKNTDKVTMILGLAQEGLSIRALARRAGVSKSTVSRALQKRPTEHPCVKNGRPALLSESTKRYIIRLITYGAFDTATQVQRHLKDTGNATVSVDTVRRVLKNAGFKAGRKRKVPLLRPHNCKARLAWAKKHAAWTVEQWRKAIWSDKTKLNLFGSDGLKWCWKSRGRPLEGRILDQRIKYGGGGIMLWGCMTFRGVGYATRICSTMDAELYGTIIEDELERTIRYYGLKKADVFFQQDNDSKHTAKSTIELLKRRHWSVLEWPAYSPDMNPIENLWAHVKQQLALDPEVITSKDTLFAKFERIWETIDLSYVQRLIDSMPQRVEALLKARGGHTRY